MDEQVSSVCVRVCSQGLGHNTWCSHLLLSNSEPPVLWLQLATACGELQMPLSLDIGRTPVRSGTENCWRFDWSYLQGAYLANPASGFLQKHRILVQFFVRIGGTLLQKTKKLIIDHLFLLRHQITPLTLFQHRSIHADTTIVSACLILN